MHLSHNTIFSAILFTLTAVYASNVGYKAAVVEYHPMQDENLPSRIRKNSEEYVKIMGQLADENQNLDIVVFPEATLTGGLNILGRENLFKNTIEVQDEVDHVSLCIRPAEEKSQFFVNLACAAKNFNSYLVVNLVERSACNGKHCASDKWDYYNTNVVFNRDGSFVSKYRKYHLFGEYWKNRTETPEISIFDTDFGTKFGMFTCFDILFAKPTLQLVLEYGMKHIVFTSMWIAQLPFLTGLQTQHMWAYELDVVMLASGANDRLAGAGGSGIYAGRKDPYVIDIVGNDSSHAYVAHVSETERQETVGLSEDTDSIDKEAKLLDAFTVRRDNLTLYNSYLVPPHQTKIEKTICSGMKADKLCCDFNLDLSWNETVLGDEKQHYQYRLVAFSGIKSFEGVCNGGVQICGVVTCSSDSIESCGARIKNYDDVSWPVTFNNIEIVANYTDDTENKIQFPNSVLSNMRPLSVESFSWSSDLYPAEKIIRRSYSLIKPQSRLMTFAIYGRDFSKDSLPE